MKWYYEARRKFSEDGWVGVVYHYDEAGNREILDFSSELMPDQYSAIDIAAEWAGEKGIVAELS